MVVGAHQIWVEKTSFLKIVMLKMIQDRYGVNPASKCSGSW